MYNAKCVLKSCACMHIVTDCSWCAPLIRELDNIVFTYQGETNKRLS